MAHMIPPHPPATGPGCKAEQTLWQALERGLDDDWFVYSHLKYIDDNSARFSEGEADFVLLHQELGMLVLECKGLGVKRQGNGCWSRRHPGGEWQPMKESPMEQAERTKWQLVQLLERRLKRVLPEIDSFPLVHGHACCFPLCDAPSLNLPLDMPERLFFVSADLDGIERHVREALHFWASKAGRAAKGLDPRQFKRFRKQVLHPTLELVPTIGGTIRADGAALVQLTKDQCRVMQGLLSNRRLGVLGGAGTGKTLMAVEAARRFARAGESVLMLCFNRQLAQYLKLCTTVDRDNANPRFFATNFHALCVAAHYRLRNGKPEIPEDRTEAELFWRDEAPLLLYEGLDAGVVDRFDTIVVDEGQDFAPTWWEAIEDLLKDKEDGRLIVFYDSRQAIFGRGCHVPEMPARFELWENLRNTQQIARLVHTLGGLNLDIDSRAPEGIAPVIHNQESPAKTRRKLEELIGKMTTTDGLSPDQIVILTPHQKKNSSLAEAQDLAGHAIALDPRARDGRLLHTTITGFKGLESDVVILLDISADDPRADRNARYVACSRARHLLHVFQRDPNWSSL